MKEQKNKSNCNEKVLLKAFLYIIKNDIKKNKFLKKS